MPQASRTDGRTERRQ